MNPNKEVITDVKYTENYYDPKSTDYFEGYIITTSKQTIKAMINTHEIGDITSYVEWKSVQGLFTGTKYHQNIKNLKNILIDSELLKVRHHQTVPNEQREGLSIIIETTQGNVIFTVGNENNGYYLHQSLLALVE